MATIPCIKNMVDLMGETMSERDAEAMLNEAVRRTKQVVKDENIPEWAAAAKVANQIKQEQKMLNAKKKFGVVRDTAVRFELRSLAKSGKSTWGKNLKKFLQFVEDLGNFKGEGHIANFLADLRQRNALDGWLDRKNHLHIWQELEQLNYKRLGMNHKAGFTGNEQAIAIAQAFEPKRMELQATNNRWGAHTEEVPGYIFLQTHSAEKLRIAGKRHKLFTKESIEESYRVWRTHMDTLNIDWGRTLAGKDREEFLRGLHTAIYNNVHGSPMEQATDVRRFKKPGGSLADKLSSQRVLWFADAESAYKYNEQWGTSDTPEAILNTLKTGGRNQAMLMHLGTRPVDNVLMVRDQLVEDADQQRIPDSQSQIKYLRSRAIEGQLDLLTGKANISIKPWLSNAVDFLKNITIAGKGGTIILTAFSDKAFQRSRMAFEGLNSLEMVSEQVRVLAGLNPDFAADLGIYNQSLAGGHHTRWEGGIRPVLWSHKGVEWTMKYQGLNRWTYTNMAGMGMVVARKMGSDSKLSWDQLAPRRQEVLTDYGFTPKEWEVIRASSYDWGTNEKWHVITPNKMQELPDEAVASLIEGKATAAQIRRMKDTLEAKLDFYISDAMNESTPQPDAAVRSIRTLNGTQRGEWSRELAELAFVFKGFPIKAAMVMSRQAKAIGGVSGTMHALALVAQAGALGYLSGVAKDAVRGRTPKRLFDLNANGSIRRINPNIWLESVMRGGGLGIFGDLLLSDYDRRYRGALEIAAGPVLGEMFNVLNLAGKTRRVALGEEKVEGLGYEALRMVENNLPLIGMFPVKQVMEYFVMWQLKEALSPGVWRRTQRSIENKNHQEYWIEPIR